MEAAADVARAVLELQDLLDLLELMATPAGMVHQETQDRPDPTRLLEPVPEPPTSALTAHPDQLVPLETLDHPDHREHQEHPDTARSLLEPDHLDHLDHLDPLETTEHQEDLEAPEDPDKSSKFPAHLDQLVRWLTAYPLYFPV